jgi:hypothetical protein
MWRLVVVEQHSHYTVSETVKHVALQGVLNLVYTKSFIYRPSITTVILYNVYTVRTRF